MISSPHLATTLLFNMWRRWSLYLNMCVAALASESLDAPGCQVPFLLEPILVELEGGRYVGPIHPPALGDLVSRASGRGGGGSGGRSSGGDGGSGGGVDGGGGNGGGGGGATANKRKSSATGGDARVLVRYDSHLPALSLRDGESTRSILAGTVLPTLHGAVFCKNWHLCRSCWEDCERKRLHVPTPPEVAKTVAGLLKAARGE